MKEGIPPPPCATLARTVAKLGRTASRSGPIWPPAFAAFRVWHEPQAAVLKTFAPTVASASAGIGELFAGAAAAVLWV